MAYFGNTSRQLLESLQAVRRTHPDLRKVSIGHKHCLFGCHGNNKSADFYQDFSENQQFYPEHAKLSILYTGCGNKVACSKDVLRHHLFRKCSVSKRNENSWDYILWSLKQALCGATRLNIEETRKFNSMLIKYSKRKFSA